MSIEDRLRDQLAAAAQRAPYPGELPAAVQRRARRRRAGSTVLATVVAALVAAGSVVVAGSIGGVEPVDASQCPPVDPPLRGSVRIERGRNATSDIAAGTGSVWAIQGGALTRYRPGGKPAAVALPHPGTEGTASVSVVAASCREIWAFGSVLKVVPFESHYPWLLPTNGPVPYGGMRPVIESTGTFAWRIDPDGKADEPIRLASGDAPADAVVTEHGVLYIKGSDVLRIASGSRVVETVLSVPDRSLAAIAADAREVWLLGAARERPCARGASCPVPPGEAIKVDATTMRTLGRYPLTIAAAPSGGSIALHETGAWFASATPGRIVRIDRVTGAESAVTFGARFAAHAIAATDSYIWVVTFDKDAGGADGYLVRVLASAAGVPDFRRLGFAFPLTMTVAGETAWILAEELYWEPLMSEIPAVGRPVEGTAARVGGTRFSPLHEGQILARVPRDAQGRCDRDAAIDESTHPYRGVRFGFTADCLVYVKQIWDSEPVTVLDG
ncbi:MAG TPA: hypothetical protein VM841_09310 [Actinomycetota bacterium]|nr:hypothetical protein [Actinomycetota bacterium]